MYLIYHRNFFILYYVSKKIQYIQGDLELQKALDFDLSKNFQHSKKINKKIHSEELNLTAKYKKNP